MRVCVSKFIKKKSIFNLNCLCHHMLRSHLECHKTFSVGRMIKFYLAMKFNIPSYPVRFPILILLVNQSPEVAKKETFC